MSKLHVYSRLRDYDKELQLRLARYINDHSPCRGCTSRRMRCHGNCEAEAEYKVGYEEFRKKLYKEVKSKIDFTCVRYSNAKGEIYDSY